MEIKRATMADFKAACELIEMGRKNIAELGIDQWQNGSPNADDIKNDIENGNCYVAVEGNEYLATLYIGFDGEPTYCKIDGAWLQNDKYATIHRVAVNTRHRGRGVFAAMVNFATLLAISRGYHALRIDTHYGNVKMQSALKKNGFTPCGTIWLSWGDERLAFEKII